MDDMKGRDLTAEEVGAVPEVAALPDGARVLYQRSNGTYDGTRFDEIDPSALYDCFYVCGQSFGEVEAWLNDRLSSLGWPSGIDVESAHVGDIRLPWRRWSRGKEEIDLTDFTASDWTGFPPPPSGWSMLRLSYSRKPAREFASDDEYQMWFNDDRNKGERWRHRARGQ